ncbi:MAG TPA: choice-of-anchor D domain-containing protein [Thermoanaerobaculia bacterium]
MSLQRRPGHRPPADLRLDDEPAELPGAEEPAAAEPEPVPGERDETLRPPEPAARWPPRRAWLAAALALAAGALAGWLLKPDPAVGVPSAAILDFGEVRLAAAAEGLRLELANAGERGLAVASVSVGGDAAGDFALAADGCSGHLLAHGERCAVEVAFTPGGAGARHAVLRIEGDALNAALVVPLFGLGVAPRLAAEPPEIDFGDHLVGTSGPRATIRVANRGSAPLAVRSVRLAGAAAGDFALRDGCSGRTLAPGEGCSLDYTFLPTAAGERRAEVRLSTDAGDALAAPPRLSGRGLPRRGALGLEPRRLDFGPQLAGAASVPATLTLTNAGTAPLSVRDLRVAGEAFAARAGDCAKGRLAPGERCTVEVVFQPAGEGDAAGVLEIAHDGGDGPARVPLAGTGTTPDVFLDPLVMDFGQVAVGRESDARFLRVVNSGTGALLVAEVRVRGTGAQAFTARPVGCTTAPVKPKSSCGVEVRFKPHRGGAFEAEVVLRHNDAGGPDRVELRGRGEIP